MDYILTFMEKALSITLYKRIHLKTNIFFITAGADKFQAMTVQKICAQYSVRPRLTASCSFQSSKTQQYKENPFHQLIGYQYHHAPGQIDFQLYFFPTFANAFNEEGSGCVRKRT